MHLKPQPKISLVDQRYAGLCTQLGDLTVKQTSLAREIAAINTQIDALKAASKDLQILEGQLDAAKAENEKNKKAEGHAAT